MSAEDPILLPLPEAARLLSLSPGGLRKLTAPNGPIPVVRIGRRCVRYCRRDLEAVIEQNRVSLGAKA
jgi:hypothetical protein